jgi:DNA-binding protein HU-beta
LNKTELIAAVADHTELTKTQSAAAIDAVIDVIKKTLKTGDTVSLIGFGSFLVRTRSARTGRNPRTGEDVTIKASKVPAFKPGKALKDAL